MASVLLVGIHGVDQRRALGALNAAGHTVLEAATEAFLRRVRERPVDAVVIDVSPLQHGVHLVGIMELRARHPALPIIAVCGGREAGLLLEIAAQAGADATLPKPFTREEMRQAVAACLARPGRVVARSTKRTGASG